MKSRRAKQVLALVLTLAIGTPVVVTLTADDAESSGWIVASGANGEVVCNPGGTQDCPDA